MKTIISLSGPIGSGKDSVAAMLVQRHGFKHVAFAGALKDACAEVFGWDRQMLEGGTDEARAIRGKVDPYWDAVLDLGFSITPRAMLQFMGTEVFRQHVDPNIWVHSLMRRLHDLKLDRIVITDARFLNELTAIQTLRSTEWLNQTQVVQLAISRKPEPWWGKFYAAVDGDFKEESFGRTFREYAIKDHPAAQATLIAIGKRHAPKGLHWSEVEFLLWPHYTAHLDNSGKLEATLQQVYATCAL